MIVKEGLYFFEGEAIDCNIYLITAKNGFVLVDTGTGIKMNDLIEKIKGSGLKPDKIKLVINTHAHFDHIGGNKFLRESLRVPIAAHSLDKPYIENADPEYTASGLFGAKLEGIPVDLELKDGMDIEGTDYKVLHTPGHTKGSICLYNEKEEVLVSGDTVFAEGCGRTDLPGGSLKDLEESLEKLSGINIKYLLPGHGEVLLEKGYESIQKALGFVRTLRV